MEKARISKLQNILAKNKLGGFITTSQINILYLTGFKGISPHEREAILVFNPKPTLITAKLYQAEANKLKSKDLKVEIVAERNRIFSHLQKLLQNVKKVGFEAENLTVSELQEFNKTIKTTKLIPQKTLIEDLRITKDENEIKFIQKAQVISQKAFEKLLPTLKVGQTEEEIAHKLLLIIKSLGAHSLAFESIIASGPNSAKPHHLSGKRKVKYGEVLLLDFGAKYKNYCADLSRTIFIGRGKDHHKNIYSHVLSAQKAALAKIKPRVLASQVHSAADQTFKNLNLSDYFIHGLGHGVGLEVHEKPSLRSAATAKDSKTIDYSLQENMVFSVEPGLYFPWGGIRIEDLVTIKNGKAKMLGKSAELIEIWS